MNSRYKFFLFLLLGLGVAFSPRELLFPLFLLFGGVLAAIFLISIYAPDDFSFLFKVFLGAFLARVLLAVILYAGCLLSHSGEVTVRNGFFVGDGYSYSYNGAWIAEQRERFHQPSVGEVYQISQSGAVGAFDYWVAAVYGFSGVNPLSMFFLTALAGSGAVLFVYLIARLLRNRTAGRWAAVMCGFWPSHILWGSQNLKEPFIIFFVCLAFWALLNLLSHFRFHLLGFGVGAVVGMVFLQPPFGYLFLLSFSLSLLWTSRKVKGFFSLFVLFVVLAVPLAPLGVFRPSNELLDRITYGIYSSVVRTEDVEPFSMSRVIEQVNELRKVRTLGAKSAFFRDKELVTLGDLLLFLPLGVIYSFLSPFPWQLGGVFQIFGVVENLILYFLFGTGVRGYLLLYKTRTREAVSLALYLVIMLLALGLFEGNVGTLFRHRSPTWIVIFIFIATGLSMKGTRQKVLERG